MSETIDLPKQRQSLNEERDRTVIEIGRLKSTVSYSMEVVAEEGDPELWEREKTLALIRTLEAKITEIDRAFRKIDKGNYGTCERCGQAVGVARLEAVPTATLCIKCKAEVERATRLQVQREL